MNQAGGERTGGGRAPYRSRLRDAQAAQTRERVLDAAEKLFTRKGYLRTTMRHIADAAEVSVETVYAQGAKQALLLAAVDRALAGVSDGGPLIDSPPVAQALAQTSPHAVLDGFAAALTDIAVRASGVLVAFEDAAASDMATYEIWAEAEQHRKQDYARVVGRIAELGALRHGLDLERAVDGLWSTVTPRLALHLLDLGWSRPQIAEWTAAIGSSLLLRSPDRPA